VNRKRVLPEGLARTVARIVKTETPAARALSRYLLSHYDDDGCRPGQFVPLPLPAITRTVGAFASVADIAITYGDDELYRLALEALSAFAQRLLE